MAWPGGMEPSAATNLPSTSLESAPQLRLDILARSYVWTHQFRAACLAVALAHQRTWLCPLTLSTLPVRPPRPLRVSLARSAPAVAQTLMSLSSFSIVVTSLDISAAKRLREKFVCTMKSRSERLQGFEISALRSTEPLLPTALY